MSFTIILDGLKNYIDADILCRIVYEFAHLGKSYWNGSVKSYGNEIINKGVRRSE